MIYVSVLGSGSTGARGFLCALKSLLVLLCRSASTRLGLRLFRTLGCFFSRGAMSLIGNCRALGGEEGKGKRNGLASFWLSDCTKFAVVCFFW